MASAPRGRVAVDTGGTFTDAYFFDGITGNSHVAKVPSIPDAPDQAVMQSLQAGGVTPREIRLLTHGTTVATNALITNQLGGAACADLSGYSGLEISSAEYLLARKSKFPCPSNRDQSKRHRQGDVPLTVGEIRQRCPWRFDRLRNRLAAGARRRLFNRSCPDTGLFVVVRLGCFTQMAHCREL